MPMIKPFVDRFFAVRDEISADIKARPPADYADLVKRLIVTLGDVRVESSYDNPPDADRITVIDHGHWQGTQLYIIGAHGYQPSEYWSIFVDYGSCSGCDAFEANQGYRDDKEPMPQKELDGYLTMMLHMVQSMRRIVNEG